MQTKLTEKIFWNLGWIYDFTKLATALLIVGLLIHSFLLTILIVKGKSMEPNYTESQILVVDKFSYRRHTPARGDVVAMYFPGEVEKRFVKRIVGLPGEKIAVKNGEIFINDTLFKESYLTEQIFSSGEIDLKLQLNEYFVLGDNRGHSSDSRAWGPVPRSFIIGQVTTSLFRPND